MGLNVVFWFDETHPQNVRYKKLDEKLIKYWNMAEEVSDQIKNKQDFLRTQAPMHSEEENSDSMADPSETDYSDIDDLEHHLINLHLGKPDPTGLSDIDMLEYLEHKKDKLYRMHKAVDHAKKYTCLTMERMGYMLHAHMCYAFFYNDIEPMLRSQGHCIPVLHRTPESRNIPYNQALLQACLDRGYVGLTQPALQINPFLVEFWLT